MTTRGAIAALAATRRAMHRTNPELENWCGQQWHAWLEQQRNRRLAMPDRLVVAVVALSCIEDLLLHVGLVQLLCEPELRCVPVLSLPSVEATRIARARARREHWDGLVRIVDEREAARIIARLPEHVALAAFPFPKTLPRQFDLAWFDGRPQEQPADDVFLGRAGAYADWRDRGSPAPSQGVAALLSLDAASLPGIKTLPVREEPGVDGLTADVSASEGLLQLHAMDGEEVRVASGSAGASESVIFRSPAALCELAAPLDVRVPVRMMTTAPSAIRIETEGLTAGLRTRQLPFHIPPDRLKPWMLSAFLNRGGAGNSVVRAFAHGTGCRIAYAEDEPEELSDVPVVWGVLRGSARILEQARARSLYFFYIDHAYFNRGHGKTYRITRNGFEAGPVRSCPPVRFQMLGEEILPWRKGGREVIVCPPTEYFIQAHGCEDWMDRTLAELRSATDRPILIREKPKPGDGMLPLPEALKTAHALVTHSSNVAIEAACLGTPVFVSPTSAAAPVGRTDFSKIEEPVYPDREPWLSHLAYNQFSVAEIHSGEAWRMLLELEGRPFV